ncbi:MAG: acetoacetate--CoA ligase [Candidatus Zixiibacteriota bacterium]
MNSPCFIPDPDRVKNSNMLRFMSFAGKRCGRSFGKYEDLYGWSVEHIEDFWETLWDFAQPIHSLPYEKVLDAPNGVWKPEWFLGASLNFAENLLRYRDDRCAIVGLSEHRPTIRLTYAELYRQVARCAAGMRSLGIHEGDRVAALIPNIPHAIIGMLAATSIGAIWSSCSPDFGFQGVIDRFGQIEPKLLLTANGYQYNGKKYDITERIDKIADVIGSIDAVTVIPWTDDPLPDGQRFMSWDDLLSNEAAEVEFSQFPFDHPLYIMYSSGTTGKPKSMVHGAGRVLMQHYKELALHTDLSREDVICYYTTCGWMMWNWLVSSLGIGPTVVLYDGSPSHPDLNAMWRMIEHEKITIFGTSPKFLSACEAGGIMPIENHDLSSLRTILSTGSPLSDENFAWTYEQVKQDVQLSSIAGGTDLVSCFMLGNPLLPVHKGEIQCRGLGMKVEVFDDNGHALTSGVGELVCTAPFPTEPLYFWNDPEDTRYFAAYFEHFDGAWRHGDFIELTGHNGIIVHGRSDATLNPGGVRIGTAEIYGPVESMDEIEDSIVVAQKTNGDSRILLFVVTANSAPLTDHLRSAIRDRIKARATPRHVPARIIQVGAIPRTINGKKVELAVTRIIQGKTVTNREALANPEALDQFANMPELDRE